MKTHSSKILPSLTTALGFIIVTLLANLRLVESWETESFYIANAASRAYPDLAQVMTIVTHLGATWFWIASIVLVGVYSTKTRKFSPLLQLILSLILAEALTFLLKELTLRPRPHDLLDNVNLPIGEASGYSFPSGHAVRVVAMSLTVIANFRWLSIPVLIIQALVLTSRIVLGLHYPLDVVGGLLLGVFIYQISSVSIMAFTIHKS